MKLCAIVTTMVIILGPLVSGENSKSDEKEHIVVHTPLQNYEQPSLRDYDECHSNRQTCLEVCDGNENCISECPRCPELTDEPVLVQGVNDTSYVPPAQPPVNTTNIIRLTNEIKNIINTDILSRNEVNVTVHQNVSQVGGRFGLGYNEYGSCCYVVSRERECDHKVHCKELSRQRVCGKRCQARVMIAKRVVQCQKDQPEDCREALEYLPARKRKSSTKNHSNPCRYSNAWPYVNCAGQDRYRERVRRASCHSCLALNFGYVFQFGLPTECFGCFQGYEVPMMPMPKPAFYPYYSNLPNFGNQPEFDADDDVDYQKEGDNDESGWVLESEKCRGANGKMEDCKHNNDEDLDYSVELPPEHLEQGEGENNNDIDDGYNVPAQRRRRRQSHRQFMRSLYSRRHNK